MPASCAGVNMAPACTGVPSASSNWPTAGTPSMRTCVAPAGVVTPTATLGPSSTASTVSGGSVVMVDLTFSGSWPASSSSCATSPGPPAGRDSAPGGATSEMRSTRKPGARSPASPPARPAAGAASASPLLMPSIARSASSVPALSTAATLASASSPSPSRAICTMASCAVSTTAPLCNVSPSLSARNMPSAPRTQACPQIAITSPTSVLLSIGMRIPCARAQIRDRE